MSRLPTFTFFDADGLRVRGTDGVVPSLAPVIGTARVVGSFQGRHANDPTVLQDYQRVEVTLADGTVVRAHRLDPATHGDGYNIVEG
jgi:hypothetical protein